MNDAIGIIVKAGLEIIMSVFEFKVKVDHKSRSTADWQPEK